MENMVNIEDPSTKQLVTQVNTVKRREYGTPVDCTDIVPPPPVHPEKYYCDSAPSCSYYEPLLNNTTRGESANLKKEKQRRKKRAKQINHKNEKTIPSRSDDTLDQLSQNLKNVLLPKTSDAEIRKVAIKQKKHKPSTNDSSSQDVTVPDNSKSHVKYSSKVFTNSKLCVNEMNSDQLNSQSRKQGSSSRNKSRNDSQSDSQTPKRKKRTSVTDEEIKYDEYLSKEKVEEGIKSKELFTAYIRINPKDCKTAYVASPNKTENDVIIEGLQDRNRALEGDLVVVQCKEEEKWRSPSHKTGKVVYILEKIHSRLVVGVLKLMPDKNKQYACFHPRDRRVPHIKILFTDWPPLFYDNADKYEQTLFLVKIKEWPNSKYAIGTVLENIGMSGDIKSETVAILRENCLDVTPYSDAMKKYFPAAGDISKEEYEKRVDLRKECIFTIDPLTARDLDDAVSCKELPNGNLEIGVHISDVTHYLAENTPLNKIVSQRATSTYMVESVYHMLPKELCMICSLLPGEDKLAFSVFWEMTPEGKILSHKFARTVINSCTQLAYEHAQMMLEKPNRQFTREELPQIFNDYTPNDLSKIVNHLHRLAVILRQARFDSGALRIDQPKLLFEIDPVTCLPLSYSVYENKECHRLIEEFMLLANITVATHIKEEYPDIAFLRSHPAPNELVTTKLQTLLEKVGILLDSSSSGKLQKSLWNYAGTDETSQARMMVLCYLCAKTMTRAHYFCANNCKVVDEYWHYALNIPLYTHFTSPIRRYADIMVHRLLAGSLGYAEKATWEVEHVQKVAANCNKQKLNAKRAGEQSIDLYYIMHVKQSGPMIEKAVVTDVRESSFDVILVNSGILCKVFLNMLPKKVKYQVLDEDGREIVPRSKRNPKEEGNDKEKEKREFTGEKKIKTLLLYWPNKNPRQPPQPQVIALFTVITVKVTKHENKMKLEAQLIRPK